MMSRFVWVYAGLTLAIAPTVNAVASVCAKLHLMCASLPWRGKYEWHYSLAQDEFFLIEKRKAAH